MRWIFASLIAINIVTFVWGLVGGDDAGATPQVVSSGDPYRQYPKLALLSELDEQSAVEKSPNEDSSPDVVASEPSPTAVITSDSEAAVAALPKKQAAAAIPTREGRPLCELVGAFDNDKIAEDFVERLRAIEVASEVKDLELPAGPGYWVYLTPLPTRQEALRTLGELQSKRIDSYVIPKGDLANGISLGMFSKKALSDARVKEMESIGLSPKVDEIERSYREIWVMLAPGEGSKMSSLTWQRAMEGINGLERRQNYCLDVASQ